MRSDQVELLKEYLELIVLDPEEFIQEHRHWIDDPHHEFLLQFAVVERGHQAEAKAANFKKFCTAHGLPDTDPVAKYICNEFLPMWHLFIQDDEEYHGRVVEVAGLALQAQEQVKILRLKVEALEMWARQESAKYDDKQPA